MKMLKTYILLCIIALISFSCEEFLEEDNRSSINSDEFFLDADGYESLVGAAYSSLRDVWEDDPWLFCLGVDIYTRGLSEDRSGGYENRDVYSSELNEYATLDPLNGFVSDFYTDVYRAIQICNTAINKSSNVSMSNIEQRVAEVKFLRAYYYYLLVEQFGDVPLVVDEITSAITHFERASEETVYEFIISELESAEGNVPATAEEFGRVTQGAVKNLLALVHLTRGYKSYAASNDFSSAASLADEVINSGNYSLQSTFEEVFMPGNEKNDEIIFSIQYDPASILVGEGNGQSAHFGWELWTRMFSGFVREDITYNWKKSQFAPSLFLFELFDTDIDSRYDATFLYEFRADVAGTDENGNEFQEGDVRIYMPRWDANLSVAEKDAYMLENPSAHILEYPNWTTLTDGGTGKFPMVWKFYDPNSLFHGNTTNYAGTRDIFLYRLAETYLIAAEAYHKSGDNAKAAERINSVRKRAASPGNEDAMEIQDSDVDIDFILDERGRELVGEYKRWMDLKRTGKLIERTLLHNSLASEANKLEDYHLLRPIPQSVIDRDSEEFPQNPEY